MKTDAFSQYHPLTNFLFFCVVIVFSVVVRHPLYLLVSGIAAAVYYAILHGKKAWKFLTGMIPLCLIVAGVNPLFNTYGETVLFHIFGRPYTLEALLYGFIVGGMLVVMMLWFGSYSAVLTSDKFVCLFGGLAPSLSMLLVMVLRLIPSFMHKAKQISGARSAIGKGVREGASNREKITGGMDVLSSLTDGALEGSIVTADSMRARGYGVTKRTSFQIYRISARDIVAIALIVLLTAVILIYGKTEAEFTPQIQIAKPTWAIAAYGALMLLPCIIQAKESITWHFLRSKI